MSIGLPITNVVNVSASLSQIGTTYANLQSFLIVGDSNVIDTYQRLRSYASLSAVGVDFLTTSPEYLAATIFFDQTPTPTLLYIGRWAKTGSSGDLVGGIIPTALQAISNWNVITAGSFNTLIAGTAFSITGLNFASSTNLNSVASIIQTAVQAASAAPPAAPSLTSTTAGSLSAATYYVKITYTTASGETLAGPEANLAVAANKVLNVASPATNGAAITGYNVYVSTTSGSETKQNTTPIAIGTAWVEPTSGLIAGAALPATGSALIPANTGATVVWNANQNCFIFNCGITGSLSTFGFLTTGTSGTDISAQLYGTSTLAQYSAAGVNAETAISAVIALNGLSTYWYGLEFAAGTNDTDIADSDHLAIAAYIQANTASTGNAHIYGLTTSESGALSSAVTTDIGSQLQALAYNRTFYVYSSQNPYAVAGLFGLLLTTNFLAQNSMINLMWKQIVGVTPEALNTTQAAALNSKNYNYYATLNDGLSIVFNGTMAANAFIDEIYGLDGLVNRIQTDLVNFMVTVPKVPQTDPGIAQLVTVIQNSCSAFVNNGYLAPGPWLSAAVGPIATGQTLSNGFYVWAAPISLQSQALRNTRVTPTIQVLAVEAGAVNTILVNLTVNR